jgi:hypothetical protein
MKKTENTVISQGKQGFTALLMEPAIGLEPMTC